MTYKILLERGDRNYRELEPNYRAHYAEMKKRLEGDGIKVSDYNPRLDQYFAYFKSGFLRNYVVRKDGKAVGHANVYVTNDMHNGDLIATEDVIYITPEHRNGLGRKLVKHILGDLRTLGVKRVTVTPVTDLRVEKIWVRMGFKRMASLLTYELE